MKITLFGKSDIGKVRSNNEDSLRIDEEIGLFIVADGMGGHNAGEVASKMAVDCICDAMRRCIINNQNAILGKIDPKHSERANQLASCVRLSNQLIYESAKNKPQYQGMGTTVESVLFVKNKVCIAHVGDSRVYLFRDKKLTQVTTDHTLVADQVKQGLITPQEAETSNLKHILTRAVGVDEITEPDILELDSKHGDILLSCSDGLNKMVSDETILETILDMQTPKNIVDHLIALANANGGVDNCTVAVSKTE